ncbi:endoribonuclease CG2145-like isoform X2 [Diachasmimorpha longicaudata]|uniref:endoribonuclease CG2145-like isoform X2 n=1 Tax=Diachasmimorpha longicaudata TaxID=58733 RepID=UPI0030B87C46
MEMKWLLFIFVIAVLAISGIDARKTSSSRRGGNSHNRGSSYSRTTSRPQHSQGSNTGTIGWNVPPKQTPTSNVKPSAPVSDTVSKTSATNVQNSNWKPSGGYGANGQPNNPSTNTGHQGAPPPYNPSVGSHNPPPYSQTYHPQSHNQPYGPPPAYGSPSYGAPPSYGGGYHAPGGYQSPGGYHAPGGYQSPGGYHAPPAYNPYQSHSVSPGVGYNPPVGHAPQTILVQGASSRPGIGQLAKEALVFGAVTAGVNAAVNRIIPGGIYGNSGHYGSSGGGGAVGVPASTHTQITYNNYYNNGSAPQPAAEGAAAAPAPAAPAAAAPASAPAPAAGAPAANPAPEQPSQSSNTNASPDKPASGEVPKPANPPSEEAQFPSPLGYVITKAEIQKLTEDLLSKDKNNAFKHITMNLQGQKTDDSVTDDAAEPLLTVKDEAYEIPTIKAVVALHDNYELDIKVKEIVTPEKRKEQNDLLDQFMQTEIMQETLKFLAEKGYVTNDEYDFKDTLRRIWFTQFKRIDADAGSSGFETVFLAEQFDKEIIGMHNWVYYAKQEAAKKLNYLGYIKQESLGDKGAIVKLRSTLNEIVQPVTTIFVGTSPELEMALYTMCFYTRPNYPCPIKLGGTDFAIISNRVNYLGTDILVSAYPEI